ncbi:LysR family transcriptional regulator [Micromonospora sp. NPDC047074]|uniref:LysR family transcriptional regulator n=1 Tax=Micromonospora sp. NPDC047074 TaxID=3154339 RepID=UPI0033C480D7
MNLAQLRALVAVVDTGGFTRAAATLGLTQSGVSHVVASLERELQLPLLSRTRDGVRLTAHGRQIIGHAREVVQRTERITEIAVAATDQHRRRLRLAAFPSAAQLLPAVIAAFAQQLPDVTVVLLEGSDSEVRAWLDDKLVDAGVIAHLDDDTAPGSGGVVLHRDRMLAVVDPDHPLAGQPTLTLADLADDPFLMSDNGCEPLLRRMYDAAGQPLRPHRRVRDMATLLALVREQLGVTVVPELSLTGAQALAAIPISPPAHRVLRLVPADTDPVDATVRALLDVAESGR